LKGHATNNSTSQFLVDPRVAWHLDDNPNSAGRIICSGQSL